MKDQEPTDAEFVIVSEGKPLVLDVEPARRREPFLSTWRSGEPVIKSWENLAAFVVLIALAVIARLVYPSLHHFIDGLLYR